MLFVAVEIGHVQRQRQLGSERAGSSLVGQRDSEATLADGHPHARLFRFGGCGAGSLGSNCERVRIHLLGGCEAAEQERAEPQAEPERAPCSWLITEDPALRIIDDDDVWQAACARAASQRHGTSDRKTTTGKGSGGRSPKYLFSGLLRCGTCGAAYVVVDRYQYGCSYNRDRGASVCANSIRVARATIESVLLDDVRRELLGPAAYAAFEQEAKEMLTRDAPDPTLARRALAQARKEADNIMNAIRAGIVTP